MIATEASAPHPGTPHEMMTARKVLVTLSAALVLLVIVGTLAARVDDQSGKTLEELKVFTDTLLLVNRNYVELADQKQLERGAFQGVAESLDPWSSYYDPEHAAPLMDRDRRGDIGVLLLKQPQQYVRVVVVVPESPADRSGVRRGEFIETIDGVATRELTLLEAQLMLSGAIGSKVKLGFFRADDEERGKTQELLREDLSPLRVVSQRIEPTVALLRVTDVRDGVAALVREQLDALVASGVKSLVLDLRTNTGGSVDEAVEVADLFVEEGPLFQRKTRTGASVLQARTGSAWTGKLVALVSRATVGQAELVAHALRARGASVLVGQPTFGKFTEQDLVLLEDGFGLFMSVAEYRKENGEPFDKDGVQPDEVVQRVAVAGEDSGAEFGAVAEGDEKDDEKAPGATAMVETEDGVVFVPTKDKKQEVPVVEPAPKVRPVVPAIPAPADDRQLQRAIEILKGSLVKKAA